MLNFSTDFLLWEAAKHVLRLFADFLLRGHT